MLSSNEHSQSLLSVIEKGRTDPDAWKIGIAACRDTPGPGTVFANETGLWVFGDDYEKRDLYNWVNSSGEPITLTTDEILEIFTSDDITTDKLTIDMLKAILPPTIGIKQIT